MTSLKLKWKKGKKKQEERPVERKRNIGLLQKTKVGPWTVFNFRKRNEAKKVLKSNFKKHLNFEWNTLYFYTLLFCKQSLLKRINTRFN